MAGLTERLESHLASSDVGHVIYGAIVGLALVIAFQDHPPTAGVAAATLFGTALAIGFAHLYAEAVSAEARTQRPVRRAELSEMLRETWPIVAGASFPAIFFVLAAAGVMTDHSAVVLSKWSGAALICGYGYLGARLAGFARWPAAVRAAAIGLIGVMLIVLKAFLH